MMEEERREKSGWRRKQVENVEETGGLLSFAQKQTDVSYMFEEHNITHTHVGIDRRSRTHPYIVRIYDFWAVIFCTNVRAVVFAVVIPPCRADKILSTMVFSYYYYLFLWYICIIIYTLG